MFQGLGPTCHTPRGPSCQWHIGHWSGLNRRGRGHSPEPARARGNTGAPAPEVAAGGVHGRERWGPAPLGRGGTSGRCRTWGARGQRPAATPGEGRGHGRDGRSRGVSGARRGRRPRRRPGGRDGKLRWRGRTATWSGATGAGRASPVRSRSAVVVRGRRDGRGEREGEGGSSRWGSRD